MKTNTTAALALAFVLAMICTQVIYASHVKAPNLPETSKFEGPYQSSRQWPCGTLSSYFYDAPNGSAWAKYFLNGNKHPFMVVFRKAENPQDREVWVDGNQDGHFDNYWKYANEDAFYNEYPTPCDAVK